MSRFAIVPATVFDDRRLTPHLRDMLALMSTYADRQGWCWPAQETLARQLGLHRTTVNYHIQKLVELGYLEAKRRMGSSLYRLIYDRPDVDGANMRCGPDQHQMWMGSTQNNTNEQTIEQRARGPAPIPADWEPPDELLGWAAETYPELELPTVLEQFKLYWMREGKTSANWAAAARKWIIDEVKRYGPGKRRGKNGAAPAGRGAETPEERRRKIARALGG